ncbi:small integral membrane protein 26-like [Astyanax mexicanus]|uniref:Small integral membrane protein 26 n=1 Tax=Astyanax mexicanus TaxID=7994 RepID=A0A8T2M467_ASTMX|nr:small integral membrane protein 26-like [Astyanax mexicanus]KAG9277857.1 small integral membrane protein 26 [Astyanax mexicanus]
MDALKWNKRAAMVYAVGVWTMLGSYGYYRYTHRNDPPVQMPEMEEDTRPNVKKIETPHSTTIMVYKENNFVPYSTRFLNLFRKADDSSSGPQTDDK